MNTIILCKFCNSDKVVKDGKMNKNQRFKCKSCLRNFINQDKRKLYFEKERYLAFILRTEGNGFRAIARVLSEIYNKKIYYQTVQKWIKNKYLEEKIKDSRQAKNLQNIQVLEMDELYTFVKKNPKKSLSLLKKCPMEARKNTTNTTDHICEYGLLLTATETKLLHLK